MLSRMAEMSPPLVPPMYSPISRERPSTGFMLKVIGRKRATPMVTVIPGMDPKRIPRTVPPR